MTRPEARLKTMDEERIDVSIVFPTLFLTYPAAESRLLLRALCRSYNEWIASRCAATGRRIRWVAALPLPDIPASVAELQRAKELGASGFLTLGTAGEILLDDARLDPLCRCAEEVNLPLCVHVGWALPALTTLYDDVFRSQSSAFVLPIFMAFVSVLAGVLDRFPTLKVGFFEAGVEWVPYRVDKLDRLRRQPPGGYPNDKLPRRFAREYIAERRVYLSCELDEKRIADVARDIGDDCILYASDLPHAHRVFSAVELLRARGDIDDSTRGKILGLNGQRFFS